MGYIKIKVDISDHQKMKIKNALQNGNKQLSIRLNNENLVDGPDVIAVTQAQLNKINSAISDGKGTTLKMSTKQLNHNIQFEGGFLGALLGAAARFIPTIAKTVLPALGVGALSGLGSVGVQKAFGKGLYFKRGGCSCKIETDGEGLYLSPTTGGILSTIGDGLYLNGKGVYDGKGIILGENSPFKNIPLLGMIL